MSASVEDRVQVGLMLAVGSAAAAYSWSHVLDLATLHGQVGWRAWVVALVTESAAVSGGLEVRRRRRAGEPARWALAALGAAVVLQVADLQLVVLLVVDLQLVEPQVDQQPVEVDLKF